MKIAAAHKTALALTVLGLAFTPAAQAGSPSGSYSGKTKEGSKVSFVVSKGWVDQIKTTVPTTCVSAQGGNPRVLMSQWQPPYKWRLGRKGTVEVKESITRHYTFESHRRGNKVFGKASISFSLLVSNTFSGYHIDTCYGTAHFSLKRR